MLTQYFKSLSHVQQLLSRPGGPQLEGFSNCLKQLGYAKSSGYSCISAASHFLCWADGEDIPLPLGGPRSRASLHTCLDANARDLHINAMSSPCAERAFS